MIPIIESYINTFSSLNMSPRRASDSSDEDDKFSSGFLRFFDNNIFLILTGCFCCERDV